MRSLLPPLCGRGLAATLAMGEQTARKPNLIFILTDDHRWDAMGVDRKTRGHSTR